MSESVEGTTSVFLSNALYKMRPSWLLIGTGIGFGRASRMGLKMISLNDMRDDTGCFCSPRTKGLNDPACMNLFRFR